MVGYSRGNLLFLAKRLQKTPRGGTDAREGNNVGGMRWRMRRFVFVLVAVLVVGSVAYGQDSGWTVSEVIYPTQDFGDAVFDMRIGHGNARSSSADARFGYGLPTDPNHFPRSVFFFRSNVRSQRPSDSQPAEWRAAEALIESSFTLQDPFNAQWLFRGPGEFRFSGPNGFIQGGTTGDNGPSGFSSAPLANVPETPWHVRLLPGDYTLRVHQMLPSDWWINHLYGAQPESTFEFIGRSAVAPEPSTWALAAAGLLALFLLRRHRRKCSG
jgi:hypothetical protein